MTLKFNRVLEVVKVRVRAKFHKTECSGSRVIVVTEKKKLCRKQYWSLPPRTVIKREKFIKHYWKCFCCSTWNHGFTADIPSHCRPSECSS